MACKRFGFTDILTILKNIKLLFINAAIVDQSISLFVMAKPHFEINKLIFIVRKDVLS